MKNIILIGFMGSGKSTIGRKLSEKYGLKHIDTDWYIEKEQNMKISDIFSKKEKNISEILKQNVLKSLLTGTKIILLYLLVEDCRLKMLTGNFYTHWERWYILKRKYPL